MKNKFIQGLLFLLFIVASASHADEVSSGDKHDTQKVSPAVTTGAKNKQKSVSKNKKTEPAAKFTPTEKLRADDVVKFPVDI